MSKWVDESKFKQFRERKKNEDDYKNVSDGSDRLKVVWKTPEKGTADKPKIYEGRFLIDPDGVPYTEYLYHMFKNSNNDGWSFSLCPKTHDRSAYCPLCSVVSKLYESGNKADKSAAYRYKRKVRYCGNFFVTKDPRDAEIDDDKDKATGRGFIYEFPGKVESKLKTEITDVENGLGSSAFDPEDGYNFIIMVKSTKPTKDGEVYPDYSDSKFSRRSSAIGDEKKIEEVMKGRIRLKDHLKKMEVSEEKIIESIKAEMLWDLIEDEYNRMSGKSIESNESPSLSSSNEEDKIEEDKIEEDNEKNDESLSEQELMKELEKMGMN